jgi:hypothetical protein
MYITRDTRFAAYLIVETYPMVEIIDEVWEGRTRCHFKFDMPEEEGAKLKSNYLSGQVTVEPNTYLTQYLSLLHAVKIRANGEKT